MKLSNPLHQLKSSSGKIENVAIFVSDSLRWDYMPRSVAQRGVSIKTVASSLFTASSFPSMVTGLYPPAHGVHTFFHRIPRGIESLLSLDGYSTSLWNENTWIECDPPESTSLHRLLRQSKRVSLEEIAPPFIYLEDEKGGHCPYGWSFEDPDYEEWECGKFFRDYSRKKNEALHERYRMGIERSVQEFDKRLAVLEERGLLASTLVIFTSDHGELLGEYGGHVGHGEITSPEIVYVPTVFIHPSLPAGVSLDDVGIMRHVDLLPTLLDLLGIRIPSHVQGTSILSSEELPQMGCSYQESRISKRLFKLRFRFIHREMSVWDGNGGHLLRESNPMKHLIVQMVRILLMRGNTAIYLWGSIRRGNPFRMITNCWKVLKYYTKPHIRYRNPGFSKEYSKKMTKRYIAEGEKFRLAMTTRKLKKAKLPRVTS